MSDKEMIEWLEREKAETLPECRRDVFQQAIDKLKSLCLNNETPNSR